MNKKRIENHFGYMMTRKQVLELAEVLRKDILLRYDNIEYWDNDIIMEFAHNNKLRIKNE